MCEHTKKLVAWMDGELPEREAAAIEKHVAQCAECRECLAAYKQASAGFDMYCDAVVDVADEARVAEERREIPRLAEDRSLRDDTVKQKRVRGAIAAGAIAAAAAIAILLMLPRQRVAQETARTPALASNAASVPASDSALHAVQRAAEPAEKIRARQSETVPAAAQRTAPLAASTGTAHRHAAERPARPGDATGVAGTQTAQNAQMRNISAALGPQGESKPQTENAVATEPPIEIAVPTENMFPPGAVPDGIGFTAVVTIAADDSAPVTGLRPRLTQFSNGGKRP